ncbi:Toxin SymE, type I toxin-antitoxin system [Halogranum amylolyticum]|uniref:Toxin SymE, type I toxin-antitoxin system n=1 Tax=Halogranum amylolyticum TaxID=660520 RepID=A0A1H8NDK7_9EURY|nr:hypothetical protein [Halogranum amylolyticum]SEO27568.1 Toxin SymE, type I toxin-antitoxin system [Halogranum amylolyticum]
MVRRKTLSPTGSKDGDGEYRNVTLNLHSDELTVAGLDVGEEVFVRVRDGKIVVQKASKPVLEHEF